VGEAEVLASFERGVRYFYWGSRRAEPFGRAVRQLAARRRSEMTIVLQSYTRAAWLMRGSLERGLRALGIDHADFLLLGWWNRVPPRRILDEARALKAAGLARHILISGHDRLALAAMAADPACDAIMVRYNAAHPGAESEIFPSLGAAAQRRVGVVSYTATRWGALLDPALTPAGEATPRASDCYRFALANPAVDVCLIGPKNRVELDEALTALDRGPMTDDELAWMKRVGVAVRSATQKDAKSVGARVLDRLFAM
jgi:aryl-alcohol dehydrogenase-like predicted oxidoreductase